MTVYRSGATEIRFTDFAEAASPTPWRDRFTPFAYVVSDAKTGEVILARDHLGVAPLFYLYDARDGLVFGDNLPDILRALPATPPLCESQVRALFSEATTYSDETLYRGIYRVEPGHLVHLRANGRTEKRDFWRLEPHGEPLNYSDEREYLEHFSELLREAIDTATRGYANVAAEFSAGLDSSAVYCAARAAGLTPKPYMQAAAPGTPSAENYDDKHEKALVAHYGLKEVVRVLADDFEPLRAFTECAEWFAGPPPYIYPMFALPLHRAVAAGKHPILLSGFGGDQGVSGPVPIQFLLPSLIHGRKYREAWRELPAKSPFGKAWRMAKYAHPAFYGMANAMKAFRKEAASGHPYYNRYFRSLREAEWSFLQGPYSHEVRMRIESASIASKRLGFEYRYPLLFPKLLEFILRIPHSQKRRDGIGRLLIRRYLAENTSETIFHGYKKRAGLGIFPCTIERFKSRLEEGHYREDFRSLPYRHLVKSKRSHREVTNTVKAFMLKHALANGEATHFSKGT